jgi:hypothetical protein
MERITLFLKIKKPFFGNGNRFLATAKVALNFYIVRTFRKIFINTLGGNRTAPLPALHLQ